MTEVHKIHQTVSKITSVRIDSSPLTYAVSIAVVGHLWSNQTQQKWLPMAPTTSSRLVAGAVVNDIGRVSEAPLLLCWIFLWV
jgi:hypothetical protein